MARLLPLLAAAVLLAGCPSFTTMGSARTLPQGKGQVHLALGAASLRDFRTSAGQDQGTSFTLPFLELGARYAVADRVELSAKLWPMGIEAGTKFGLVRSESPEAGVSVALAPSVSTFAIATGGPTSYFWVHAPVLVGFALQGGSEVTLGPRLSYMHAAGGGDTANVLVVGTSVGYAWKVSRRFRIVPEVTVSVPVASSSSGPTAESTVSGAIVQTNLGFIWGGE